MLVDTACRSLAAKLSCKLQNQEKHVTIAKDLVVESTDSYVCLMLASFGDLCDCQSLGAFCSDGKHTAICQTL